MFEGLDNGEILCAACPNTKVFITGGISCVSLVIAFDSSKALISKLFKHIYRFG